MASEGGVPDLLAPLEPEPADLGPPPGTVRGQTEGLGAGLEVWVSPAIGWRPLGALLGGGCGCLVQMGGRLRVGLAFDLGEPHA
jgi:hypothetical protein